MDLRRVRYNKKDALLITGVTREQIAMVSHLGTIMKVPEGYLMTNILPSTLNKVNSIIREDDWKREREKRRIEAEKKLNDWKKYIDSFEADRVYAGKLKKAIIEKQSIDCSSGGDFLMNHQKAGVLIAERFDHYGFFYDTGTGKTLLALQIIQNKIESHGAVFLVLCPKSIIQTAWMDDGQKFFPGLRMMPLVGNYSAEEYRMMHFRWAKANGTDVTVPPAGFFVNGSQRDRNNYAKQFLMSEADCFIVNPEMFIRDPEAFLHIKTASGIKHVDGLIVDESSKLKNPRNIITRTLQNNRYQFKFVYLLSGKPAPNKLKEYIPQIELIDPNILRPGIKSSLNQDGNDVPPAIRRDIYTIIDYTSITVSKSDCFDLPPAVEEVRTVSLESNAMKQYNSMKDQMRVELEAFSEDERTKSNVVYVNHVLACISKLRQIAGGFIYDDEKKPVIVHDTKMKELLAVLDEVGNEPILVWCQYQYEIEQIEKELKHYGFTVRTAYSKTKDLNESIYSFKSGKAQVLIAHPRTLQYGVTLVNCCYAVYYSTSYSYEEYYQSHDRIYRKGQSRPCTYIFLQVANTIDEVMLQSIKEKQTNSEVIENAVKHIFS